jgi:hypothetical protein
VSKTKELKTCYEAKKRSCSTCCTTSQVYDTFSFGKCAPPCRVLHSPVSTLWKTKYMSSVDAACVYECGGPTHDERRRAIKSLEWRLSDAARAVWVQRARDGGEV